MSRDAQIGTLLVAAGVLTPAEVEAVRAAQETHGERFCSRALAMGLADERDLLRVLARQRGCPGVASSDLIGTPEGRALVPAEVSRRLGLLPLKVFNRTVTVAMRDPHDAAALNDVQFHAARTARPMVALAGPLAAALDVAYGAAPPTLPPVPELGQDDLGATVVPVAPLPLELLLSLQGEGTVAAADPQLVASLSPHGAPARHGGPPAPTSPSSTSRTERDPSDPRPCILAVDDEPSILKLYAGMLDPARYRLVTCDRGDLAIDAVRTHQPQLVLLDGLLPGVHGFEICRLIKQSADLTQVRVILLSAAYRGWQMRADLVQRYGADEFIEKPFDVMQLLETIDHLTADARAQERRTRPLPTEALRHLNQGLIWMQQGELEAAEASFRRSIAADALAARPYFYLGKILERRGAPFDAMYAYERAVELDASFFPVLKDLAILYQSHGFVNKAVDLWQQALVACPEESMRGAIRQHLLRLL